MALSLWHNLSGTELKGELCSRVRGKTGFGFGHKLGKQDALIPSGPAWGVEESRIPDGLLTHAEAEQVCWLWYLDGRFGNGLLWSCTVLN